MSVQGQQAQLCFMILYLNLVCISGSIRVIHPVAHFVAQTSSEAVNVFQNIGWFDRAEERYFLRT